MEAFYNLFKRQDVFRCYHESHKKFSNVVSVYHVLEKRRCFPQGCLSFYFKCKLLLKGVKCKRGLKTAGIKCQSCKYLMEEKNQYFPKVILKREEWEELKFEYSKFLFWIKSKEGKTVKFYGKIQDIKPYIRHIYFDKGSKFIINGYFILMEYAYIEEDLFKDKLYIYVPKPKAWKIKKLEGNEVEGLATFNLSGSNIILSNAKNLQSIRGEKIPFYLNDEILLKIKMGSIFDKFNERCFSCEEGLPVLVENQSNFKNLPKKEIICLQNYLSPSFCLKEIYKNIKIDKCSKEL